MNAYSVRVVAAAALVAAGILTYTGCTVKDTIYLQSVSVSGPVKQPPLVINADDEPGSVHLSPYASFNTQTEIRGHVDQYPPTGQYVTSYDNLTWQLPRNGFGLDVDVSLSRAVALTFGLNGSPADGDNFFGGRAGIGLLFRGETVSGRLDGGVQFQEIGYDVSSVVVREVTPLFSSTPETTVGYFVDHGSSTLFDYYVSLTLNTKSTTFPVNVFGQFAFSRQTLTNFTPYREVVFSPLFPVLTHIVVDTRAGSSASFLMFTPGISVDVGNAVRLLAGVRFAKELEITDSSPDLLLIPVVQCDFSF